MLCPVKAIDVRINFERSLEAAFPFLMLSSPVSITPLDDRLRPHPGQAHADCDLKQTPHGALLTCRLI
jgi:hypothetical protein